MNQQNQPQNRSNAPYTGPRRPPQGGQQQNRRPSAQSGYPPRADGRQGFSQPQTVNRPPRPYGEPPSSHRPPLTPDGRVRVAGTQQSRPVRMQVQCSAAPRRRKKRRWPLVLTAVLALLAVMGGIITGVILYRREQEAQALASAVQNGVKPSPDELVGPTTAAPVTTSPPETEPPGPAAVMAVSNSATLPAGSKVESTNAIVIDVADGTAVAERLPDQRIYPASMTKVMTLIVAYEEIESFEQTFTFTADLINPLVTANASRAGFMAGETVPVIDLFYAAALPSGADATTALAEIVAGSEAAFAERMNQKAAEMGLTGTHFTNASGLHDDNHYSTVREIAAIFAYAMQIEPLREIMSSYQYTTAATPQNPEGLLLTSTLFAYLAGDELPGMKILAGKTGYTIEAKRCLVSMGIRDDGREYIAVVAGGENKWIPITDSVELYAMCLPAVPVDAVAETTGT
ncbi:MAG: serine hydrolase [Clostridia bacterium]|nr:serine hydrolase [Clostridia bacterium]